MKRTMMIAVFMLFAGTALAQEPWLELTTYKLDGEVYTRVVVLDDPADTQGIAQWAHEKSNGDSIVRALVFEEGKRIHAKIRLARAIEELRQLAGAAGDDVLTKHGIAVDGGGS